MATSSKSLLAITEDVTKRLIETQTTSRLQMIKVIHSYVLDSLWQMNPSWRVIMEEDKDSLHENIPSI